MSILGINPICTGVFWHSMRIIYRIWYYCILINFTWKKKVFIETYNYRQNLLWRHPEQGQSLVCRLEEKKKDTWHPAATHEGYITLVRQISSSVYEGMSNWVCMCQNTRKSNPMFWEDLLSNSYIQNDPQELPFMKYDLDNYSQNRKEKSENCCALLPF